LCVQFSPLASSGLFFTLYVIKDGGFWDFTADLAHGDTAYTNLALKAHTDSTYFVRQFAGHIHLLMFIAYHPWQTDPCGLQIFHLLSHTEGSGGESLLVDGFRAAAKLGHENKKHLETLSRTLVPTHAVGDSDYHYIIPERRGNAIVTMDPNRNEAVRISYNNDDRGTIRSKSLVELDEWRVFFFFFWKILE
jgi:trimethyllysine dioxygenase